ncbi:lipopolysaccharide biosynthesis protein [Paracidovorax valerianellae]|uniref:Membrane protein involved in the export of O-antigen and teichoic acid n=1 Tax=Paracidovorax valerianellae TaxID=187868 RepID=A0A1G6VIX8_9BURK|nr:oligosaccharide flippase family protein [Paracidovorax valerianellae]MDA8447105.1 oligosaccharide flippase family protein [Paracidovorax valerianellae]SDD53508.1 Membrane protein involved in the export of O-antigen and teichoic acid [Paracidovorax valerianellae]
MSLKRNILANYVGSGAVALAPILALPWYLAALGPLQFGFVGFVTTLQAVLNLLDAGMSQALVREISLRAAGEGVTKPRTAALLYGFERLYWALALLIGLGLILLATPIARHWLHLDGAGEANGRAAVIGAAAIFATMFPGSLYRSVLVGTERQVALNKILFFATLIRHVGAVIAVTNWPSLITYLAWHMVAGLFETGLRARVAWSATGMHRADARWQNDVIRQAWPAIAGLATASGLGALTMQLDKALLSNLISITDFGYYVIASSAAAGVLQLVYPLMQAVLPRAFRLKEDPAALRHLYNRLFGLIALAAATGMAIYAAAGKWLLGWWLKDMHAVSVVYPLLGWLLFGAIINAFYNVGYAHWLVLGRIKRILQVNLLAGMLCLLIIPPMVSRFGMIGATSGWLIINFIGFIASLPGLLKIDHER